MSEGVAFSIDATADGEATNMRVSASDGSAREYRIKGGEQADYTAFYHLVAEDFGTRRPHVVEHVPAMHSDPRWKPLITDNLSERILAGFGDPAVLKTDDGYVLIATSNDAPDAFPMLRSDDLVEWTLEGFAFPEGQNPEWTIAGTRVGDFWAPEIARVGDDYWLAYTARNRDHSLSIGLARSKSPTGPWADLGRPLLTGGTIDAHLFVATDGTANLFWKEDRNGLWPRPLAGLLRERPELIERIFTTDTDRRTAAFAAAVQPWANGRRPIERFFLMQPFISAALANWPRVGKVLREAGEAELIEAMRTPIFAQALASDGASLVGERVQVLEVGHSLQEQDAFDQAVGLAHLRPRLALKVLRKVQQADVLQHPGLEEILIDGGQLARKNAVQMANNLRIALHNFPSRPLMPIERISSS